jgi:hypothetical protein
LKITGDTAKVSGNRALPFFPTDFEFLFIVEVAIEHVLGFSNTALRQEGRKSRRAHQSCAPARGQARKSPRNVLRKDFGRLRLRFVALGRTGSRPWGSGRSARALAPASPEDFDDAVAPEQAAVGGTEEDSPEAEMVGPPAPPRVPARPLANLAVALPRLMWAVQRFLGPSDFRWFHPSDVEHLAKPEEFVVKFGAGYVAEDQLTLDVTPVEGDADEFAPFVTQVSGFIIELLAQPEE